MTKRTSVKCDLERLQQVAVGSAQALGGRAIDADASLSHEARHLRAMYQSVLRTRNLASIPRASKFLALALAQGFGLHMSRILLPSSAT